MRNYWRMVGGHACGLGWEGWRMHNYWHAMGGARPWAAVWGFDSTCEILSSSCVMRCEG